MNTYEHRYEERAGEFLLDTWGPEKRGATLGRSPLNHRPEWLVRIVDTAIVGGYARPIPNPPPDVIVWFITDENLELVRFMEFPDETAVQV